MIKGIYKDGTLMPQESLELQEGDEFLIKAVIVPPSDSLGFLTSLKSHAVYQNGVFVLKKPVTINKGTEVLFSAIKLRSMESFQGILCHIKEDSVSLQHRAKEWW